MNKPNSQCLVINPITLGKIGSVYGVKGWLKVFSFTEDADSIFKYQPWFIQSESKLQQIELESWKHHRENTIIKIKHVDNRNTASKLTRCKILIDSSQLPVLKKENYYWKDLIGCKVATISGYEMGTVVSLIETGSNDVLVVKSEPKNSFDIKERLIPFLYKRIIKKVDLTIGFIEVDWDPEFDF